jgi:hypothetical protein
MEDMIPPRHTGASDTAGDADRAPLLRKPDLMVRPHDLPTTVHQLAKLIAASGLVYDRARPVRVVPGDGRLPRVIRLITESIVLLTHELARPVELNLDYKPTAKTLRDRVARLYLALDDWGVPHLKGITTAPVLSADGAVRAVEGYDPGSGLWCTDLPELQVPDAPTLAEAQAALRTIRKAFATFPFADAPMRGPTEANPVPVIDTTAPPGHDESAFLAAIFTAVCRSSLPLAPGLLISAPMITGAGTGKGLLVRAICEIAYGLAPRAITAGADVAELEKRLGAVLIEANQVVFIDNVNSTALKSDLLACVLTEPQVDMRPLGTSRQLPLCPNAFVALTGNGLSLSEDLARRFLVVQLDPRMADPEARRFQPGFLKGIAARRSELLAAVLTIWRWGRQTTRGATRRSTPRRFCRPCAPASPVAFPRHARTRPSSG